MHKSCCWFQKFTFKASFDQVIHARQNQNFFLKIEQKRMSSGEWYFKNMYGFYIQNNCKDCPFGRNKGNTAVIFWFLNHFATFFFFLKKGTLKIMKFTAGRLVALFSYPAWLEIFYCCYGMPYCILATTVYFCFSNYVWISEK